MIIAEQGDRLFVVTQPDHARMAAELLSLWIRDGLPHKARRDQLLFAMREHDNGWREADSAPRADLPSGRPHDFLTIPDEIRREIWLRGTARFQNERPYESLLILRHAGELHRARRGEASWQQFFATLDERTEELLGRIDSDRRELAADYRLLRLGDRLSLAACGHGSEDFEIEGYKARRSGAVLALSPFPLAGATTFKLPCRWIPNRAYRGDADLGGELAAARWAESAVRVAPQQG